jgi:dTDP-4-amino-4,6-dideoxygalactose transaminase
VFLRTRLLYRIGGVAVAKWKRLKSHPQQRGVSAKPAANAPTELSAEWTRAMTPFDRKLALHNLRQANASADIRRRQAETYIECLGRCNIVRGFDAQSLPQNHFPIRVAAAQRERLLAHLRSHGIDAGMDFPFPARFDRADFPNAAKASEEVLALPMGERVTIDDVRMISQCIVDALAKWSAE